MGRLWTIEDVAKYLQVSVPTVYRYVHLRQIPYIKIGSGLRFKADDIESWLESKKTQPLQKMRAPRRTKQPKIAESKNISATQTRSLEISLQNAIKSVSGVASDPERM